MKKQTETIYAAAVVGLALALRLYQLGTESLWGDEGCSLRDAAHLYVTHGYRPVYYLLLRGWMELGLGNSEFILRLPAVLFGVTGVWVLYALGHRVVGSPAALLASVFMAISVLQINHSQEVRMYSLVALTSLVTTYYLMLWRDSGRPRYAIAYVLSALILLLTFPLTVLVLAAHGLYMLLYVKAYRPRSLFFLGSQLVVAAVWLPWLLNNMHMSKSFSEGYIASLDKPTLFSTIGFLGDFFLWKCTNPARICVAGAFGFSLGVILVALYGLKGFHRSDADVSLIWLWLVIPVAGTIVLCYKVTNVWMVRYLIAASPAFYLLVSRGILSLRNRYVIAVVLLAVIGLTSVRLGFYYTKPSRPQWRQGVEYVQTHEQPGDVIGLYSPGNKLIFSYYYHGKSRWSPLGAHFESEEQFGKWDEARVRELFADFPPSGKRYWLMLSKHQFRGGFSIIKYVEKHYRILDYQRYYDLELYLFNVGKEGSNHGFAYQPSATDIGI